MEVFSINKNVAEQPFQSRDLPIHNQPLFSGNRLSDYQSEQITTFSPCHRHMIGYLETTEKLVISQKVEILELLTGIETSNKYEILDSMGQKIFLATEQSDCCPRFFLGSLRSFQMQLFDNLGNNVIRIDRHLACQGCPFLMQQIDVFCPTHFLIGYVKEEFSWVYSRLGIFDKDGLKLLEIQGPLFQCAFCCKAVYEIKDLTGEVIGSISKQWMGFLQEVATDADTFSLDFPLNLDVNMKILLLAASFLIVRFFLEILRFVDSSVFGIPLRITCITNHHKIDDKMMKCKKTFSSMQVLMHFVKRKHSHINPLTITVPDWVQQTNLKCCFEI